MKNNITVSIIILMFTFISCKKEEGTGGRYSIKGKIFIMDYNSTFSTLKGSFYAQNESVYIIYGDDATYGDNQKTNYDGTYEFKYLRKGKYTIYAYSDTSTSYAGSQMTSTVLTKKIEVTLSGDKTVELTDLILYK